jgi:hypothetical protein
VHRRGLFVRAAWLRLPYARLVVVARGPWLGVRCWSFRGARRQR